jgi:hypothetical protein
MALPPPLRLHRTNTRNTSGVVGVFLARTQSGRKTLLYWRAFCCDGHGRKRLRTFSVAKYGYVRARALAVRARKQMVEALLRQARSATAIAAGRHVPRLQSKDTPARRVTARE